MDWKASDKCFIETESAKQTYCEYFSEGKKLFRERGIYVSQGWMVNII